jgi:uncharacterized C2H2 Zn-finger protein
MSARTNEPEPVEVEYVTINGRDVPAERLVCPRCGVLDLQTEINTSTVPWVAHCSRAHGWAVEPPP